VLVTIDPDAFYFESADCQIITLAASLPPVVDLVGSTLLPPVISVGDATQLAPACALRLEADLSSFIILGRPVPQEPGGWLPDFRLRGIDVKPSETLHGAGDAR
jgi:hypothetical protein